MSDALRLVAKKRFVVSSASRNVSLRCVTRLRATSFPAASPSSPYTAHEKFYGKPLKGPARVTAGQSNPAIFRTAMIAVVPRYPDAAPVRQRRGARGAARVDDDAAATCRRTHSHSR